MINCFHTLCTHKISFLRNATVFRILITNSEFSAAYQEDVIMSLKDSHLRKPSETSYFDIFFIGEHRMVYITLIKVDFTADSESVKYSQLP